ncbi:hypothetical protein M3664_04235 [Paenibacillus lautus]|uniref:hypothetical protein n=1 Tax=Paenibacillus lautus TaxID=1401 RepID=UPI00203EB34C|nr:hypothetical protein [Paenibacillus lautus]MCM3256988.1 hypothetical protein [Paenibacillus lautus]
MSKRLTASALNKLDTKLNTQKVIHILANQFEVKINTFFRESQIQNIVTTYLSLLQDLKSQTEIDDLLIQGTIGLLNTLTLREFTDLPIPKSNSIVDLIKVSKTLLDTGIMKETFEAFDQEQMSKIEDKIKSVNSEVGKIVGELSIASTMKS